MGMVPGAPLTEGFLRLREKQYTPTLIAFDHQLSPATGQGKTSLVHPGALPEPDAALLTAYCLFSQSPSAESRLKKENGASKFMNAFL